MSRGIRDIAITALAPLMWGTTYIVTTELLPEDRPLLTSVIRALPAGLLLMLLARKLPRGSWWWRAGVIGALNIAAFFGLLFIAAYRLPGGVAAVVGAVGPLVSAGLTMLVLKQEVKLRAWILGIAGVAGVGMVVLNANAALDTAGIIAGLAAAVSMTTSTVLTKRWGSPEAGPAALAGWQLTAGGLLLVPVAFIVEGGIPAMTTDNILGYLYLGLVNTALGYWLWFRGIRRLSVIPLSFLGLLSPLMATVAGWVILGQSLTVLQLAGMVVAFGSTLLGQTLSGKRPAPTAPAAPSETPRREPVLTS